MITNLTAGCQSRHSDTLTISHQLDNDSVFKEVSRYTRLSITNCDAAVPCPQLFSCLQMVNQREVLWRHLPLLSRHRDKLV